MVAAANMVEVAALVGDTARATILAALMGGQALTGSELAILARISRPTASTCYDHLAGRLGVAIADALAANGHIILTEEGGEVTDAGSRFLTAFGADLTSKSRTKRIFCRPCLDWSERRYHVAGLVGAEIWRRCLELDWLTRGRDTRAVRITSAGRTGLYETFGLDLDQEDHARPIRAVVRTTA